MNIFRIFNNKQEISIPKFQPGIHEDSIELQIKSLSYIFKRLRIHQLSSFLQYDANTESYHLKYGETISPDTQLGNEKLDLMYNLKEFEQLLIYDEYRIFVDFIKNKFRSMCILSDTPNLINGLPSFIDYTGHKHSHFKFSILRAESSDEEYVTQLSESQIFVEHHNIIDLETRKNYVGKAIELTRKLKNSGAPFDRNDRSNIIRIYLTKLSYNVQLDRIFKTCLKKKQALLNTPEKMEKEVVSDKQDKENKPEKLDKTIYIKPEKPTGERMLTKKLSFMNLKSNNASNGKGLSARASFQDLRSIVNESSSKLPTLRPTSPTKLRSSSPNRLRGNSPSRLRATSPSKNRSNLDLLTADLLPPPTPLGPSPSKCLRKKPSMSLVRIDKMYSQPPSPRGTRKVSFSDESDSSGSLEDEERTKILNQCKLAVKVRLDRERKILFPI